jgi:hypothetical protein
MCSMPNSRVFSASHSTTLRIAGFGNGRDARAAIEARQVMIGDGQGQFRLAQAAAFRAHRIERHERAAFVDEIQIDIQQIFTARLRHDRVLSPDLVQHRARFARRGRVH